MSPQMTWIVKLGSQNGRSFTLKVSGSITFFALDGEMTANTGLPHGHTMLFKGDTLVNRYPWVTLSMLFPNRGVETELTLRWVYQERVNPSWFLTNIPTPPRRWRSNNLYEKQHPDFLPEHLREKGRAYFQSKSDHFRQDYEKTEQGREYLRQLQPSLEVWGGLMT